MEKHIFKYGSYSYEYYLVRQERLTISLIVQPSLRIVLKCPANCSDEKIQKFLKNKWKWLEKQLLYFRKFKNKNKKEYISGESFLYLGRQYKLYIKKVEKDDVKLKFGRILLHTTKRTDNKKYNKKLLKNWYGQRAFKIFGDQYIKVLKNFDYDFETKLIIRKMNKRWGSFLNHKKIILNPVLIQAPKECIDYVITHELCHMKYKNHDKKFYDLLKSKIKNWEEVKEKLELRFL
ncbi:M48 family metallopeptidase [Candidatus Parcubacteria bacterium]|nr:M48 family metallopeptidase [Candidatus Parcubacteria bacterium]